MPVQLGSAFGMIRIGYDGAGIGQALTALGGLMQTIQTVGQIAERFIIQPLAAIGREVVRVGSAYEDQMAILGVAARSSGTALETLDQAAMAVGEDTSLVGVSAADAAEAMTNFYKAGLTTNDIFSDLQGYLAGTTDLTGALRSAVDLAAASDLSLAQASDTVAIAMATFGLNADDAERIANSFVRTADASVSEVGELVMAMQNIGPTAAQLGWSIEETNQALGILSQRGIRGSEAGTALKSMMMNLMRPTKDVRAAFQALGVQLYDQEGQLKGLPTIIGELEKALYGQRTELVQLTGPTKAQQDELSRLKKMYASTMQSIGNYEQGLKGAGMTEKARAKKLEDLHAELEAQAAAIAELEGIETTYTQTTRNLTEEERNEYMQRIAGTYGIKALTTLLEEGATGWNDMTAAVEGAATVQDVAAARTNTFSGAMEALDGVLETFKIRLWGAVKGPLTGMARWAADWVSEQSPKVAAAFGGIVDSAQKVFQTLSKIDFAAIWQDLKVGDLSSLTEALSLTGIELGIPDAVINMLTFFLDQLQKVVNFLGATVPQAVAKTQAKFAEWVGELEERFPAAFSAAGNIVSAFFEGGLPAAIQVAAGWFGYFGGVVGDWWLANVFPVLNAFQQWWAQAWPIAQAVALTAWTIIQAVVTSVRDIIVNEVWPQLQGAFEQLNGALADMGLTWGDIFNALKQAAGIMAAAIGAALLFLISVATGVIAGVVTIIASAIEAFRNWVGHVQAAMAAMQTILINVGTFFKLLFEGDIPAALKFFVSHWSETVQAVQTFWSNVWGSIRSVFDMTIGAIIAGIGTLVTTIITFFQNLYDRLVGHSLVPDLVDSVVDAFTKLRNMLMGIFTTIKTRVFDPITTALNTIREAAKGVINKIAELRDLLPNVKIPAWLQGHSPPPMAEWFDAIAAAAAQLSAVELPRLAADMRMATMPIPAMARSAAPAGGAATAGPSQSQLPAGLVHIDRVGDDVDVYSLAYEISRYMKRKGSQ